MKATNKDKLRKRARNALCNMYHNATLPFSDRELPETVQKHFGIRDPHEYESQWIADTAEFEIDYINDGGAYGGFESYRNILRRNAARKYRRLETQAEYVRQGLRDMERERSCYARWERIPELYGKVYQWGRGGRTLAPKGLIRTYGGSSFGIDYDVIDDMSAAALTELCLTVESFNAHVKAVCDAFPDMWAEHLDDLIAEYNAAFAAQVQAERPDMYAQPCSA